MTRKRGLRGKPGSKPSRARDTCKEEHEGI